ncbi:histidine kinase [Cellulomonas sp. ATA003]|uniref:sensor histidine kinase n=1 Tax=Cellulomonas sp. ATA003 TaxID=3073064 RepID=UPI002873C7EF|nr:histidine kinase [Cellulomonas sp. ATA003]WNB85046.1 histidine kinase [Cellulomonas sp. ATA003]
MAAPRPLRTALVIGALAVVTVAALGTLNGLDLAIAFVLYAVAASSPPRTAWLTLTASLVVVGAAVLAWERPLGTPLTAEADTGARVGSFTGLLILYLVALAIGTGVRNRRLHVASVVDRANALAVEREQGAQLAAAAERARIAREMHDVVAHSLSVMIALADGAGVALERSPARSREALEELSATGRSALADMRRVLGALRDPGTGAGAGPGAGPGGGPEVPLDPQPGSSDLERLVEGFRTAGVPVRWTVSGPPLPPDAGLQLAVYRIVQESLTNVLRHAPGATRVDVVLAAGTDRVDVVVTDTGAPTPRAPTAHRRATRRPDRAGASSACASAPPSTVGGSRPGRTTAGGASTRPCTGREAHRDRSHRRTGRPRTTRPRTPRPRTPRPRSPRARRPRLRPGHLRTADPRAAGRRPGAAADGVPARARGRGGPRRRG